MIKTLMISALLMLSMGAWADAYIGGGVDLIYSEFDDTSEDDYRNDMDSQAVKLFFGYRFNPYLGAEIGVAHVEVDGGDYTDGDGTAIRISIIPNYPVTDTLDAYLSLSYVVVDASIDDSDYSGMLDGYAVGVGITKHFGNDMFIRGGLNSSLSNDHSSQTSIGASFDVGFTF